MGARLQIRRGSAPTTGQSLGNRGAQDRRSDPTQYHSHYGFDNFSNADLPFVSQIRRAGQQELLRQSK